MQNPRAACYLVGRNKAKKLIRMRAILKSKPKDGDILDLLVGRNSQENSKDSFD